MALLITKENQPIFLSATTAKLLWFVHTGERKGTAETRKKAARIDKWYLNRITAPPSYLKAYPDQRRRHKLPLPFQVSLPYKD